MKFIALIFNELKTFITLLLINKSYKIIRLTLGPKGGN